MTKVVENIHKTLKKVDLWVTRLKSASLYTHFYFHLKLENQRSFQTLTKNTTGVLNELSIDLKQPILLGRASFQPQQE
jgi:hypothetical protein